MERESAARMRVALAELSAAAEARARHERAEVEALQGEVRRSDTRHKLLLSDTAADVRAEMETWRHELLEKVHEAVSYVSALDDNDDEAEEDEWSHRESREDPEEPSLPAASLDMALADELEAGGDEGTVRGDEQCTPTTTRTKATPVDAGHIVPVSVPSTPTTAEVLSTPTTGGTRGRQVQGPGW